MLYIEMISKKIEYKTRRNKSYLVNWAFTLSNLKACNCRNIENIDPSHDLI